jgi:hypothetical protein
MENYSAFGMVEHGLGIMVTNELSTKVRSHKMKVIPPDPDTYISLGVAFPTDTQLTPAAAKFIDYTKLIIRDSSLFCGVEQPPQSGRFPAVNRRKKTSVFHG